MLCSSSSRGGGSAGVHPGKISLCIHTELSTCLSDKSRSTRGPDIQLSWTWVFCLVPFMKTGSVISVSIEGKFISHEAIVTQDPFLNLSIMSTRLLYTKTSCSPSKRAGFWTPTLCDSPEPLPLCYKQEGVTDTVVKGSSRKQSCVAITLTWLAYVKRSPELENCHVMETLPHPPEHDDSYVEPRSQVGKALLHKDKPDSRHLLPWKWFHLLWTEKGWGWDWDRK